MLTATLIAVFLIPMLFVVFERLAQRFGAHAEAAPTAAPTPAEGA
jgi:hypothetical protein